MIRSEQAKAAQLSDAMENLVGNPNFELFMKFVRESLRESAVVYMTDHTTTKDQREWLVAAGEVRCYDKLWECYQHHLQQLQLRALQQQQHGE